MDFKDIVMKRYAAKKFNGETIPEEKIDELKELIRFSASSFNLQPWKIKVITNQETKDKLLPVSWNQPQITTCSHLFVFCADTHLKALIDKLEKAMLDGGADEEKVKIYVGLMREFESNKSDEEILIWAQKQIYIALGNALNGAKELGFDSCPMEGFDPNAYKEILKLDKYLVPTLVCPVGYAADESRTKKRFPSKDIYF